MRDIKSCNTDFTKGNNIKKKKIKTACSSSHKVWKP